MSESAATANAVSLGARLRYIRGGLSQQKRAALLEVAVSSYQHYERDERSPDAAFLAKIHAEGWNMNWLLSGAGPERMADLAAVADERARYGSQSVKPETLTIALQLASEALEEKGLSLPPAKRSELVAALYDLLEEGLPEAKVLRFARTAAA